MLTETDFERQLMTAQAKLQGLVEKREALDREIARLRQDIGSLAQLARKTPEDVQKLLGVLKLDFGLSALVLEVLKASDPDAMTPSEVMDGIIRMGFRADNYKNLLPSIHTTLRRMANGEHPQVLEVMKDAKKAYLINNMSPEDMKTYNLRTGGQAVRDLDNRLERERRKLSRKR